MNARTRRQASISSHVWRTFLVALGVPILYLQLRHRGKGDGEAAGSQAVSFWPGGAKCRADEACGSTAPCRSPASKPRFDKKTQIDDNFPPAYASSRKAVGSASWKRKPEVVIDDRSSHLPSDPGRAN
jgi:hypothetical protein